MESSGGDKQNESDECDVNDSDNRKREDDRTGQENVERKMKAEDERETPPGQKRDSEDKLEISAEGKMKELKKLSSADDEEADEEDEKSKASVDEEERKEETTSGGKKEEESSSDTTSTSTSDDESETSSEDKTEPSKPTENTTTTTTTTTTAQAEKSKDEPKDKNEDTTDDSDIEDDLVSAINYNTITSLAALKDMLQSSGENSDGVDSFFHHYFLSHVNRLPSRNQTHSPYPWGRRLSECREEDEYETEEGRHQCFTFYLAAR